MRMSKDLKTNASISQSNNKKFSLNVINYNHWMFLITTTILFIPTKKKLIWNDPKGVFLGKYVYTYHRHFLFKKESVDNRVYNLAKKNRGGQNLGKSVHDNSQLFLSLQDCPKHAKRLPTQSGEWRKT